ncbi:Chromosome segregation protein Spc25 [Cynara cardunculus var. scolymus]|uniref:Kinetochore protein SPC25 n=1 Tax=Cynara cardunculus var. scolymus TaxID=59895 RepID=A0A103XY04_CYNCS|nr:Chromosome segregation protein Spc25 [Cynara cardunculus var. scolymus]
MKPKPYDALQTVRNQISKQTMKTAGSATFGSAQFQSSYIIITRRTNTELQMTMHRGRVGDREVRGKMAELRLVSDKEIEIQQQRMESAAISFRKSLQSIKSSAQETVSNQEKIGKLKAQLRAAEDDLVKALSVKTRKEAKKMAIADSISATKARIEEHKKIVADQRARKDEYAEIISHQCEVLEECEKKHNQDAELREEIGEAISWYNRVLGFRIERGRGIKFIFTNINPRNSKEEYYFTIRLENDNYYCKEMKV